jgi:hypothetical protein
MNKTYLIAIAAALMAAPLVMAHDPAGTPNTQCELQSEWNTHDYGAPASGVLLQGYEDGNLDDCDNSGVVVGPAPGRPCPSTDPSLAWDEEIEVAPGVWICFDRTADFDGHAEYARGGAWILVNTGNGVPSADPNVGAGTEYCYGDEGHHAEFGPVTVNDVVLGAGATFTVAADNVDLTTVGEGCGDFESDNGVDCVGTCTSAEITFPAGLDGSYQVYVQGTLGHVVW